MLFTIRKMDQSEDEGETGSWTDYPKPISLSNYTLSDKALVTWLSLPVFDDYLYRQSKLKVLDDMKNKFQLACWKRLLLLVHFQLLILISFFSIDLEHWQGRIVNDDHSDQIFEILKLYEKNPSNDGKWTAVIIGREISNNCSWNKRGNG